MRSSEATLDDLVCLLFDAESTSDSPFGGGFFRDTREGGEEGEDLSEGAVKGVDGFLYDAEDDDVCHARSRRSRRSSSSFRLRRYSSLRLAASSSRFSFRNANDSGISVLFLVDCAVYEVAFWRDIISTTGVAALDAS